MCIVVSVCLYDCVFVCVCDGVCLCLCVCVSERPCLWGVGRVLRACPGSGFVPEPSLSSLLSHQGCHELSQQHPGDVPGLDMPDLWGEARTCAECGFRVGHTCRDALRAFFVVPVNAQSCCPQIPLFSPSFL